MIFRNIKGNKASGYYTKASFVISDNLARLSLPPAGSRNQKWKCKSLSCERLLDEIGKFLGKEGLKYLGGAF
jgi:hypothetical protein